MFELPTRKFDQICDHATLPLGGLRLFRHQICLQVLGSLIGGHRAQVERGVLLALKKNQALRFAALGTFESKVAHRVDPQGLLSLAC